MQRAMSAVQWRAEKAAEADDGRARERVAGYPVDYCTFYHGRGADADFPYGLDSARKSPCQ